MSASRTRHRLLANDPAEMAAVLRVILEHEMWGEHCPPVSIIAHVTGLPARRVIRRVRELGHRVELTDADRTYWSDVSDDCVITGSTRVAPRSSAPYDPYQYLSEDLLRELADAKEKVKKPKRKARNKRATRS
jgi:hypothetical protein